MLSTTKPDSFPKARYVDKHRSEIIQRAQRVMAVTRKLLSTDVIDVDTYSQIRRASSKQEKIRTLFAVLEEEGDGIKSAFYFALMECEMVLCLLDLTVPPPGYLSLEGDEFQDSEVSFVDKHRFELIQRVTAVMPVVDELLAQHRLNNQTHELIRRASTTQEQMRELYRALDEGGNEVKSAFYTTLKKYDPRLFCYIEFKPVILQYKTSIIDRYEFVMEYNLPSEERVKLTTRYTEPVIIQKSKEQTEKYCQEYMKSAHASGARSSPQLLSNDKNQNIRIDQLFSPDSDGNIPKTVILSGDSGRGKSFMLQKIMLDWASGELYSENFDAAFILNFDDLKYAYDDISLTELLSRSFTDQISQMLEFTPERLLILVDGIDDFLFDPYVHLSQPTSPSVKTPPIATLMSLLKGQILPECFLLVTSRSPSNSLMKFLRGPQRFTEIEGFSERGVQEYFQKFFQDEELFRKTYESVKTSETLLTYCSVPLLCWMVCFCLKKHFKDVDQVIKKLNTITSIYVEFVSTLLEDRDKSQSLLRTLGQLAEEGILDDVAFFGPDAVSEMGLSHYNSCLFLFKELNSTCFQTLNRFMHLGFQEFFMALNYVLQDEEQSHRNIRDTLAAESVKGLSNPISSALLFLCGLSNEDTNRSLFKKYNCTFPHTIRQQMESLILTLQDEDKLLALRFLYELQDEEFTRRALAGWTFVNLSNVSLRSTDCLVLLYCLQFCPSIRYLNLMYCGLTADKLKILIPTLALCKILRLSVDHLSEVGDLISALHQFNILKELKFQEDEYSSESPRWSLDLSVTHGEVFLSLSSSEKNPSFPTVLNISLTCGQSQMSNTDWTLLLQRLSRAGKLSEDSSALDDHVHLLLSSFHSMALKTMNLTLVSLSESWASGIIALVQNCTSLQQLSASVTGLLLEEGLELLKKSLSDPHCTVIIEGLQCNKSTDQCRQQDWGLSCNEKVQLFFKPEETSGLFWLDDQHMEETSDLSWDENEELFDFCSISTDQSTELEGSHSCIMKTKSFSTEEELEELEELNISDSEASGLDLHCQSCVHIADSDQWLQVEPSVCGDEGGSEFRISTQAGRFQCSRTGMRWVCDGDVTLQYRPVDGHFLSAELERLQYERIAPVFDVNVISGKLEEAHLPHYICLAEAHPALIDSVKLLKVEDDGLIFESVELTRFHAKVLQPTFSPTTLAKEKDVPVEEHLDLLIFMTNKDPLILHVYFFPLLDTLSREKIMQNEIAKNPNNLDIEHPRPDVKFQMNTPHILDVSDADVLPKEGISFSCNVHPNFFMIRHHADGDVEITLSRQHDKVLVWETTVWKQKLAWKQKVKRGLKRKRDSVRLFDNHWSTLIDRVKNVLPVADKLLHQQLISEEQYSVIKDKCATSQERMREICLIMRKCDRTGKAKFISVLQKDESSLLKELEEQT